MMSMTRPRKHAEKIKPHITATTIEKFKDFSPQCLKRKY